MTNSRILILDDGYHTPHCVCDNKQWWYSREELIEFLCAPHKDAYELRYVYYEYIPEEKQEIMRAFEFLDWSDCVNQPEFAENFNTLWQYKEDER